MRPRHGALLCGAYFAAQRPPPTGTAPINPNERSEYNGSTAYGYKPFAVWWGKGFAFLVDGWGRNPYFCPFPALWRPPRAGVVSFPVRERKPPTEDAGRPKYGPSRSPATRPQAGAGGLSPRRRPPGTLHAHFPQAAHKGIGKRLIAGAFNGLTQLPRLFVRVRGGGASCKVLCRAFLQGAFLMQS